MIQNIDEKFKKCFELAIQGETLAFPNPNVACLIYFNEELLSYGIHREFGKAHAEVIAINNLKEVYIKKFSNDFKSFEDFAAKCELVINLEPCSHYGNTPPCTLLIKESGFKKLAFAAYDTNPNVYKKSLEIFNDKDFDLIKPEDLSEKIQAEAQYINRVFFAIKERETKNKLTVWLSLKIASYPDGNMITKENETWITSEESRKGVHRLRSSNQILITTSATIKTDKPRYNVRHEAKDLNLLDTKDPDLCIIYHDNKVEFQDSSNSRKLIYERLDSLKPESLAKLIQKLSFQGYQKIMIEAGPTLSHAFLDSGLIDELIVYQPQAKRDLESFRDDHKRDFGIRLDHHIYQESGSDDYLAISFAHP